MLSTTQARKNRAVHYLLIAVLMTAVAQLGHQLGWGRSDFIDDFALDRFFNTRGSYSPDAVAEKLPQSRRLLFVELPHSVPRPLLAQLIRKLKRADLVALDLMLVDEAKEINEREAELYRKDERKWQQDTQILAAAIKYAGNVAVGAWPEKVLADNENHPGETFLKTVWQKPHDSIWNAAKYHAHLRLKLSDDGVARRFSPFDNAESPLPALSLIAAAIGTHTPLNKIRLQGDKLIFGDKITELSDNSLLIDYLGERDCFENNANRVFYDLVLGGQYDYDPVEKIDPLKGMLVFVGQTQEKTKDTFATPFGDMPGVHTHMHATATLMSDMGPPLPLTERLTFFIALFFSLLLTASLLRFSLTASFLWLFFLLVLVTVVDATLFIKSHRYFHITVGLGALVLTYNAIALYEYKRAHTTLSRVVGPKMARTMMNPLRPLGLGGQIEEATAFFCDLRSYSLASESMPIETLSPLVFDYTNTVTTIVQRFGGRAVDFFGDGVFILFEGDNTRGPLQQRGHHALRAMKAALEVQGAVKNKLKNWHCSTPFPLRLAIGINTGPMLIGIVGSETLMKLGAIGDAVNVAARVQGLTNQSKFDILITQESHNAVKEILKQHGMQAEFAGVFSVHNRNEPVTVLGLRELSAIPENSERDKMTLDFHVNHVSKLK